MLDLKHTHGESGDEGKGRARFKVPHSSLLQSINLEWPVQISSKGNLSLENH